MKSQTVKSDFFSQVLEGIRRASRKMAEKSAANNEEIIIADKEGRPISVPAKDALKNT